VVKNMTFNKVLMQLLF